MKTALIAIAFVVALAALYLFIISRFRGSEYPDQDDVRSDRF